MLQHLLLLFLLLLEFLVRLLALLGGQFSLAANLLESLTVPLLLLLASLVVALLSLSSLLLLIAIRILLLSGFFRLLWDCLWLDRCRRLFHWCLLDLLFLRLGLVLLGTLLGSRCLLFASLLPSLLGPFLLLLGVAVLHLGHRSLVILSEPIELLQFGIITVLVFLVFLLVLLNNNRLLLDLFLLFTLMLLLFALLDGIDDLLGLFVPRATLLFV